MNLKVNREPITYYEKKCDSTQEQSVELDYVLPDYYPEIFRIVKCISEPRITSCAVNGDRITYELTVCLKVIYCSEGKTLPEAVDQKLTYTRTVNLDSPVQSSAVSIKAVTDSMTCRAVNRRRIDIRGSILIHITAVCEQQTDVICDAFGDSIYLKKTSYNCPSGLIRTQKRVTVSDDFELNGDSAPIGTILRCNAEIISSDKKTVGSKTAAKGELKITMLYSPASGNDSDVSVMQFTMPYSHLIDMDGMDETYDCRINTEVISCDISPRSEGDGETLKVECEVMLMIDCEADKMSSVDIVSDEYSTAFESEHNTVPVKIRKPPVFIDSSMIIKGVCENKDSPFVSVYDSWCDTGKLRMRISDGSVFASGNIHLSVIGKADNGDFIISETDVPVDEEIFSPPEGERISEYAEIMLSVSTAACTYNLSSDNTAEVKAEISVKGRITDFTTVDAITEITVHEDMPKNKNDSYALRLYYPEEGESLWDISKKYGASVDMVIEENDLDGTGVADGRMLLIPVE